MAVGTQFLALVDMLREDAGRSTNVGVGIDDIPLLQRSINRSYAMLLDNYDWPHLRALDETLPLSAGQRFYDFPTNINVGSVVEIVCWQSANLPLPLERGISFKEYAAIDSRVDQRSDPPQKWDMRFNGTSTQIEIWPIPNSNTMELQVTGRYALAKLVNDSDICRLDDELVVLGAAYRLLERQKSADASSAKAEFQARLSDMRKRSGPASTIIMGGGATSVHQRPTVSVRR